MTEKPRMRQVRRWFIFGGPAYLVWRAEWLGHVSYSICPVWAYCEVREKARRGW